MTSPNFRRAFIIGFTCDILDTRPYRSSSAYQLPRTHYERQLLVKAIQSTSGPLLSKHQMRSPLNEMALAGVRWVTLLAMRTPPTDLGNTSFPTLNETNEL